MRSYNFSQTDPLFTDGSVLSIRRPVKRRLHFTALILLCLALVSSACNSTTALSGKDQASYALHSLSNSDTKEIRQLVARTPDYLKDQNLATVEKIFAEKQPRQRRDNPAMVLQYANNNCVLDLFFVHTDFQGTEQASRVAHLEMRNRQGAILNASSSDARKCMSELITPGKDA